MFDINTDHLERFTARQSDDYVKRELELTCDGCGDVVCDVEDGDTLAVLARTVSDHVCL